MTISKTQLNAVITAFNKFPAINLDISDGHAWILSADMSARFSFDPADQWLFKKIATKIKPFDELDYRDTVAHDTAPVWERDNLPFTDFDFICKAMPANDVRYYLCGVAAYKNGALLATDGHRMHYDSLLTGNKENPIAEHILPGNAVALYRKIADKKAAVDIRVLEGGTARFYDKKTGLELFAPCVDGRYPDVFRVLEKLPKADRIGFTAPIQKELNLMVSIVKTGSKYTSVLLKPDGSIFYNDSAGERVPLEGIGNWLLPVQNEIGVNAVYLRDALLPGAINDVQAGAGDDPLLIQHNDTAAAVMPMWL